MIDIGDAFDYRKVYEILKSQAVQENVVVFALHPSDVHLLRQQVLEYNAGQELKMFNVPPVSMFSAVPVLDFIGIDVGKGRWYKSWFYALSDLKDIEGFDIWRTLIEHRAGWELMRRDYDWLSEANKINKTDLSGGGDA